MSTKTEAESVTVGQGGLAWIVGTELSVGDLLALIFLYRWCEDDLLECIRGLTPRAINDALAYSAANPETVEGQFYYGLDPCPLMRAVGLL
jgi:uncharacterized protein (DUF433 family)